MKNYFQKILALFTGNDYPEATRQEFYQWLVDEEYVSEKDEALQYLWEKGYKARESSQYTSIIRTIKKECGYSFRTGRTENPSDPHLAGSRSRILYSSCFFRLSFYHRKKTEPNLLQQYIPTAEVRTLTLPDGTKVQLNSQSTLFISAEIHRQKTVAYF